MLITKEQAELRLMSSDNLANKVVRVDSKFELRTINHGGRNNGGKNLSSEERTIIGALAHLDTEKNVAREFGISRQHVDNIKHGRVGARAGDEKIHPELKKSINEKLDVVKDVALAKLMDSLGLIDDVKLSKCDAKDLSGIAANMSKVVNNVTPKEINQNGPNIIIYAPQQKDVEDFKVVEI